MGLRFLPGIKRRYYHGRPEYINTRLTIDTANDFEFCQRLLKIKPELSAFAFGFNDTKEALGQYYERKHL